MVYESSKKFSIPFITRNQNFYRLKLSLYEEVQKCCINRQSYNVFQVIILVSQLYRSRILLQSSILIINQLKTSLDFNSLHRCTMITVEINLDKFHSQNYQTTQLRSSSNVDIHLRKMLTTFEIISTTRRRSFDNDSLKCGNSRRGITEQESPESPTFLLSLCLYVPSFPPLQKNPRRILPNPIFALQSILRRECLKRVA